MAVMQVLDEAKAVIDRALKERSAPDDEVRWDLSLTMMPMICHGHFDEDGDEVHDHDHDDPFDGEEFEVEPHIHPQLVYSLFVSLGCPEMESEVAIAASLPHCPGLDLGWLVDKVWTHLSSERINMVEFEMTDGEWDEDEDDFGVPF